MRNDLRLRKKIKKKWIAEWFNNVQLISQKRSGCRNFAFFFARLAANLSRNKIN